ncbi:hypothetical protein SDC9_101001 [bioreactor metagenome]|uniref:Uncharacterized protein n=1 Tax=bioreactor metagenome TaxID=1076179 RepID=A0A645AMG1_9ZZZZ
MHTLHLDPLPVPFRFVEVEAGEGAIPAGGPFLFKGTEGRLVDAGGFFAVPEFLLEIPHGSGDFSAPSAHSGHSVGSPGPKGGRCG